MRKMYKLVETETKKESVILYAGYDRDIAMLLWSNNIKKYPIGASENEWSKIKADNAGNREIEKRVFFVNGKTQVSYVLYGKFMDDTA
jgi:hypothetical protein